MPSPWTERMFAHTPRPGDCRHPFELDYSRVIHSEAFRRLAGVTQILAITDSDFSRNRLTHSLEVGQVALGIVQHLCATIEEDIVPILPDRALMQTISTVHDIGHPPFGHDGETVLNWIMRDHGGFESNGQTLRVLTKLIDSSDNAEGGNLTRRALLGTLKYPIRWSEALLASGRKQALYRPNLSPITGKPVIDNKGYTPPKCYLDTEQKSVDWMLRFLNDHEQEAILTEQLKSIDCSIMDISDDVSYGIHDLEDSITLSLIKRNDFEVDVPAPLWDDFLATMPSLPKNRADAHSEWMTQLFETKTKSSIGKLVHYMITNTMLTVDERFDWMHSSLYRHHVGMSETAKALLTALKRTVFKRVILAPSVQHTRVKGQAIILDVFAALHTDPGNLLPHTHGSRWRAATTDAEQMRTICDYVAGLTDTGLIRVWKRFHDADSGSVFDSLR